MQSSVFSMFSCLLTYDSGAFDLICYVRFCSVTMVNTVNTLYNTMIISPSTQSLEAVDYVKGNTQYEMETSN